MIVHSHTPFHTFCYALLLSNYCNISIVQYIFMWQALDCCILANVLYCVKLVILTQKKISNFNKTNSQE